MKDYLLLDREQNGLVVVTMTLEEYNDLAKALEFANDTLTKLAEFGDSLGQTTKE